MAAAWILLASALVLTLLCAVPYARMCGKYKKNEKTEERLFAGMEREELSCYACDAAELRGVLFGSDNAKGTLILFHGWHSSWQRDFAGAEELLRGLGLNLLFCEERAHGASKGAHSTLGIKESGDVLSWVTAAEQLYGEKHPIFLLGTDMGAFSAMAAADGLPASVRGIIAVSGYSDARDMIKGRNKRAPGLAALLTELYALGTGSFGFAEKVASEAVKNSHIPILMIHGEADTVIPLDKARALFDECAGEKRLLTVSGAEHDGCFAKGGEKVGKAIEEFLKAYA